MRKIMGCLALSIFSLSCAGESGVDGDATEQASTVQSQGTDESSTSDDSGTNEEGSGDEQASGDDAGDETEGDETQSVDDAGSMIEYRDVSAGVWPTCALAPQNVVRCFGDTSHGQRGTLL